MENHDNYISKSCEIIYLYPFLLMGHGFATSLKTHLTPLQFLSFRRAEHGNLHQVGPLKDFQDNPWDFWSWKSPKNGAGAPLPPHPVGSPGAIFQLPLGTLHRLGPEVLRDSCKTIA